MRLTVGPLPSAVYWRRRAVVLGVLLAIVAVVYASCGTGLGADPKTASGSSSTSPTPPAPDADEGSEPAVLTPESGAPPSGGAPAGGGDTTGGGAPAGGGDPGGTGSGDAVPPPQAPAQQQLCTDAEITVTPVPAKSAVAGKSPLDIKLIIQNSSNRSCARDVGADVQELRVVQGAAMIWSSDHCGAQKGSDVRTLSPGMKLEYGITWNGKSSSKCAAGEPAGVYPTSGQYQLLGRLGTKNSEPIALTIQ